MTIVRSNLTVAQAPLGHEYADGMKVGSGAAVGGVKRARLRDLGFELGARAEAGESEVRGSPPPPAGGPWCQVVPGRGRGGSVRDAPPGPRRASITRGGSRCRSTHTSSSSMAGRSQRSSSCRVRRLSKVWIDGQFDVDGINPTELYGLPAGWAGGSLDPLDLGSRSNPTEPPHATCGLLAGASANGDRPISSW